MSEFSTQETSETRLAALLGELLEGEGAGGGDGTAGRDVPAEIAEMRDMARLLRAASQSVPLPEGRLAVRRALLATLEPDESMKLPARAAWRRTGRWLGVAAMAGLIIAAFGLGAGLLDNVGSAANPLYGLRRAVDRVRLAFVPGRPEGGPSPFVSPAPRIPEAGNIPPSGIAGPASMSGYPLGVQFSRIPIPSVPGREMIVEGKVGGLPVTLSLTATTGCPAGAACGTFEVWVTPFRGTKASPEFGQMRGTFICASGQCTLTPVSKTGVFNTTSAFVLQRNGPGEFAGLAPTGFDSLGDWVATVAQVAEKLNAEDLLPPGVTVKELVNDASTNKTVPRPTPQGRIGSSPSGFANSQSVGVPTGTGDLGVPTGTGMGSSPSLGAEGFPGGTGAVPTTSTSVTVAGTTVTTSGTINVSSTTPGTSTPSTSGTVSVRTSTSGTTNTTSGSASGGTTTGGTNVTGSGSVSGGVSGGTSGANLSGGVSTSGGTASGSGTATGGVSTGGGTPGGGSAPSGGGAPSGGTGSGGGVNVGVGGVGVSVGGGGVSVGAGGGTGSGGGGTSGGGLGTR